VRTELKWAEVSAVKAEVEQQVAALLGPKTEEDAAAAAAPKKKVRSLSWPALCID
jgi:Glutaminyl-tRNA synthetase, non-specific RNA binding region part 2